MSFFIIGGERFALEYGDTILGGREPKSLSTGSLADLPPFAVVAHPVDGPTTIRALGTLPVHVSGAALRSAPDVLQHGDRIEVSGIVMAYGEIRAAGRTSPAQGATEETPLAAFLQGAADPTASTGGRLTRLDDRSVREIPETGITLGRDPSCDLVLASKDVSRVHAVVAPSMLGYTLTDRSSNGVWVNGARVEGSRVLRQGDVIRIAGEDFRFEADAASFEPDVQPDMPALDPGPAAGAESPLEPPAPILASIEVLSGGSLKGLRFRVTRPTVDVGRAPQNDIQLGDESVSSRHASLIQRGNTWTILDLQSRNGTFVEGEIVRDQRTLPRVCELQLGTLKLLFRAIDRGDAGTVGTVSVIGLPDNR